MQTFLPYADFADSSAVLDTRRLGKQRVETFQILRALTWPQYAWKSHPAVRMWRGFVPALVAYGLANCAEWTRRGFADSVRPSLLAFTGGAAVAQADLARRGELPPWLGQPELHRSHRSALLRKDPAWYGPWFRDVPDDLPYWWPPAHFPRWPVRASGPLALPEALGVLGFEVARPGQAEAAAAVRAGRDCVGVFGPGSSGRDAGLLAGLGVPAPTLWVLPGGPDAAFLRAADLPAVPVAPPAARAPAELTARPPSAADLAAMAAEAGPAPWRFVRAAQLDTVRAERVGLLVLEDADALDDAACARVAARRGDLGGPSVLALLARTDAKRLADLARALGLVEPVHVGGGWDVRAFLRVRALDPPAARRIRAEEVRAEEVRAEEVRADPPALVLTRDRSRSDRVAAALLRAGLRAAAAVPGMRADRPAAAAELWRRRRLDALVVTLGTDLKVLGRVRPTSLLGVDPPPRPEQWRDLLAELNVPRATLLAEPDAPPWAREWAAAPGCLRAWLLDRFGEPAPTGCGRCARCAQCPRQGP
jgi:hypothetical protein